MKKHGTWEVLPRPEGVKRLSTRFVFFKKRDENGKIIRLKARLVVRDFLQGNVGQTFAPVVDFTIVRTCLSVAVQMGYFLHQLDVRTAFLHGEINDEVYIKYSNSIMLCESNEILTLKKGLYGLKQAPRMWNLKFNEVMNKLGFKPMIADMCVHTRRNITLLMLMGPEENDIENVKVELGKHLDVKNLGMLQIFLGVIFVRKPCGAYLTQRHYIRQVLERYGMSSCKSVKTPMAEGALKEMHDSASVPINIHSYQELLGCLLFLSTRTRSDLSAAIAILCRYTSDPRQVHWIALKRVLRYLQGTSDNALRLVNNRNIVLEAFCDADRAGGRKDRKSTTGNLILLGGCPILWRTLKQHAVALSTTEAEFSSLTEGTKQIIWIRKLLSELGLPQRNPTRIMEGNKGAIT